MRKYMNLILGLFRLLKELILNTGHLKIRSFRYFLGSKVRIQTTKKGICDLGNKTWISDFSQIEVCGGRLQFGYNNFLNTNCRIAALERIEIGDNNLFGPNVVIVDHDHEYRDQEILICKQGFKKRPVQIGSNNWICANVVITKGSIIRERIIVAANSVVSGELLEPGIYAGSPAVKVRDI